VIDTSVLEGEETTDGGSSSSSDPASSGALDASGDEPEDPGREPEGSGGESGATGSESGDTSSEPGCGNGIIEVGEACEGSDLASGTCEGLGLGLGTLACDDECEYDTSGCVLPRLSLSFSQIKRFDFTWDAVPGAEHYQVFESLGVGEPYAQLGGDVSGESVSFEMPLHFRWQARYVLRACNAAGCTDSAAVDVVGSLAEAVGYFKGSNTREADTFGGSVALSGDGNTLVVGAQWEDSNATGIGGNQADDSAMDSGAVYVFVRDGVGAWSQAAYVKASNTDAFDRFGHSVALSGDGNTLAVGAYLEDGNATGIGGNEADDSADGSGAVYVYVRDAMGTWSQAAYVKALNTGADDFFGLAVALSEDGNTLAVGAVKEDSNTTGIGGSPNESAQDAGAVYVFVRDGAGVWSPQAYVKASNTGVSAWFGSSVALSEDGDSLAVGSVYESSNATGIGGDQTNSNTMGAGAVYVFVRDGAGVWSQQAYVKASNTGEFDLFGYSVALSGDGDTLAVGAYWEDSSATGIEGNQADEGAPESGAVYVFVRDGAGAWSQEAYVKASNTGVMDYFGYGVELSGDGNILAVGAYGEASTATGIGGYQASDGAFASGAVYVFVRDGAWSQEAYVKAPNPESSDSFGDSVALSGDGNTLAVGAKWEDSSATGIGGNQADGSAGSAGAVYLF